MKIIFHPRVWEDYCYWQQSGRVGKRLFVCPPCENDNCKLIYEILTWFGGQQQHVAHPT